VNRGKEGVNRPPGTGQYQANLEHSAGNVSRSHRLATPQKGGHKEKFEDDYKRLQDDEVRNDQAHPEIRIHAQECLVCELFVHLRGQKPQRDVSDGAEQVYDAEQNPGNFPPSPGVSRGWNCLFILVAINS